MIKLLDILNEIECWDGYKQGIPKTKISSKTGKRVNNCVPINENEETTVTCENCGWKWQIEDGGKDTYICHKCGHDNGPLYGDIDEYDIENEQDLKEFIQFMNEYSQMLAEADCSCITEAEYHGHKVALGKPMQGDIKKFKVYVKNNKGKVVKVNFGAHGMNIKRNNPVHRNAYRKRHNCDNPGPRWKANYWSCRKW